MKEFNTNRDDEKAFNQKWENEITKLKMQAELGATFFTNDEVPPELESLFLKNVYEFEKAWHNNQRVTIRQLIGSPEFDPEEKDPETISGLLKEIFLLLDENQVYIEIPDHVDEQEQYRFLTKEFFEVEVSEVQVEGMMRCFCYEEFYPDHDREIRITVERFFDNLFRKNIEGVRWDLEEALVIPGKRLMHRDECIEKLQEVLDEWGLLSGLHFQIDKVNFQFEDERGVGHVEGTMYYEATLDNQQILKCGGGYMIFLNNSLGFWNICYFIIPGMELT